MHLESVRPDELAREIAAVDDAAAKELQQTLERSRQGGYIPITAEEKSSASGIE